MKNILRGLAFWMIVIAFIVVMTSIAQILTNLATMDMIMTIVYVTLGYSLVYILKN